MEAFQKIQVGILVEVKGVDDLLGVKGLNPGIMYIYIIEKWSYCSKSWNKAIKKK